MTTANRDKINSEAAPTGEMGEKLLAAGDNVAMRMWIEDAGEGELDMHARDYETVGYVIQGRAELLIGDSSLKLGPGDSWLVPSGVPHKYQIAESFHAIEATSPPAGR